MLHAHLPFVRHPEHRYFLEENWLYEAITATHLPFIRVLREALDRSLAGWAALVKGPIGTCARAYSRRRGPGPLVRLTMSLSPPLCSMLRDGCCGMRYCGYLSRLCRRGEEEVRRKPGTAGLRVASGPVLPYPLH